MTTRQRTATETMGFLAAPGELAERIRAYDWTATSIGPLEGWPQSLKTTVGLLIRSPVPIVLLWGDDGIMIYNDAYADFAGLRHPQLLGSKVREGWPEVADFNDNVMKVGLAGGTLTYTDMELELDRRGGGLEWAWLDLGYSPVIAEDGKPGGVIAIVVETTDRVLATRRNESERDRLALMFAQAPSFMALVSGPEHYFELANPGYIELVGGREVLGKTVADALPEVIEQGFLSLLDQVYQSSQPYSALGAEVVLRDPRTGGLANRYLDFVYQPVSGADGRTNGVFIQGVDVTPRIEAERRREALANLTSALSGIEDPVEVAYLAAKVLGETTRASRAGYVTLDPTSETVVIERDWCADGVATIAGVHHLRDYGRFIEDLKAGRTVVVRDAKTDPRTAENADRVASIGVRAFVNEPIIEQGRLVALLFVHDRDLAWRSQEDIDFVREVSARTRTAVERARAARSLRASEARFRFLDTLAQEVALASDADQILAATTRNLAQHMGVSLCAYADMDADEDGFTIRGDWAAPGSSTIVGHYRLADFGELAVRNLSRGLPLVVNDNRTELAPHESAAFQAIGVTATICMPLIRDGKLTALMAIHDKGARVWSADELALMREVTARSWAHIERVAAAVELRASEKNFRTMAAAMPNQVWTARPDGLLDWFSAEVYAYSGAEPGSLDGDQWATIVHPDDLPFAAERWAEAIHSGNTYQTEFRLRRTDGAYRWHVARAVPIMEGRRILRWIGSNTDIEDQKAAAQALADINTTLEQRVNERTNQLLEAEEALRQAQKMEAIGQLTGGVAHDFNNLLAAIGGSFSLIERRLRDGKPGVDRYLSAGQDAVRRAATLTQRLLAFARRQTLDPRPIDCNKMISGMEELIRRSVGPSIDVEVVGAAGLWPTLVDPSQLESALLNLCINGRDAMMPNGGRLTIETANKWLDQVGARERELPPGQYISLSVTDTGAGMTPEIMARAFDPFFTTKPLGQGTGLGLSMIYGFVRQSGGQVRIYSEVGQGTTVSLYLPRYVGALVEDDSAPPQEELVTGEGETVLVVDDEASLRMLIVDVLREAGYRVLQGKDGQTAMEALRSDARIDLLITDVGLPGGMNGRQIADAARTSRPALKVLFITGYADNAVIGNGHLERGMQVLTKPFDITGLALRVRDLLERES